MGMNKERGIGILRVPWKSYISSNSHPKKGSEDVISLNTCSQPQPWHGVVGRGACLPCQKLRAATPQLKQTPAAGYVIYIVFRPVCLLAKPEAEEAADRTKGNRKKVREPQPRGCWRGWGRRLDAGLPVHPHKPELQRVAHPAEGKAPQNFQPLRSVTWMNNHQQPARWKIHSEGYFLG